LDNSFGAAIHNSQIADIGPDVTLRAVVCDKGYHAKTNRKMTCWRGIVPIIHYRSNVQDQAACFPKLLERTCVHSRGATADGKGFDRPRFVATHVVGYSFMQNADNITRLKEKPSQRRPDLGRPCRVRNAQQGPECQWGDRSFAWPALANDGASVREDGVLAGTAIVQVLSN
jgi:hypothetical protein